MLRDLSTRLLGKCINLNQWTVINFSRYATGWNYFCKYAIVLPNNLTAAGIIIQYWRPDLNIAIFVTVFAVVIVLLNVSSPSL